MTSEAPEWKAQALKDIEDVFNSPEAEARGYARAIEEAFDKVESLSHDWGEDGCAYIDRDEALTEIRALAMETNNA